MNILPIYIGYKLKLIPEVKMKAMLMYRYTKALRHLSDPEVNEFFSKAASKMADDFNETVIQRISEHKHDGFYTLIVSGAFMPLLEALNQQIQADLLIGTKISETEDGFDHVHAERKTELIHEHLHDTDIRWEQSCAYGDSISDQAVLELTGHPVAVCPDKPLEQLALKEIGKLLSNTKRIHPPFMKGADSNEQQNKCILDRIYTS